MMWILINTTRPTGVEGAGGPGCGARGRQRGLAGQRADAQSHTSAHQAPQVWRAPEGPGARASLQTRGLAAVPVGGGGAWPGFETTRRAKLAARTARGRAAAHGHTKQPGPSRQATRRPQHPWGHKQHRNTTRAHKNAHPEPGGRI